MNTINVRIAIAPKKAVWVDTPLTPKQFHAVHDCFAQTFLGESFQWTIGVGPIDSFNPQFTADVTEPLPLAIGLPDHIEASGIYDITLSVDW